MTEPDPPGGDPSYADATAELERILDDIERGAVDIDVLTQKVARAAALIKQCRERLTGTEMRVAKVIEGLVAEQSGESA
jgi:exodeoxyribonuclease VII small subunit